MSAGATPVSRQTVRRCARSVQDLLNSEVRWRAIALAALLVGFLLAINGLSVVNSYVARNFMTAVAGRDLPGFTRQALLYLAVFAASTVVAVLQTFTEQRLGTLWRWRLTRRLARLYLSDRNYYWLKGAGGLDNPDERIAEDVKTFTATTLSFALIVLNGVLTAVAFAGVLWSISPRLFGVAVGYAALGSLLAVLLGRSLVGLNSRQLDREADFRSALVHVRENAEAVALTRHEGRLTARLLGRIDALVDNQRRITSVNRNLGFFTTGYNYLIQILPALIVAPLFIRGEVEFGVVAQSGIAFAQLLGAFSLVVNQYESLSSYAAVTARLGALGDAIDRVTPAVRHAIETVEDRGRVACEGLTLRTPNGDRILVKDLSAEVRHGARLLVTGPNEVARVALLRAVAGLWGAGAGRVVRPPLDEILFLPQRPYLPPGTLRELLLRTGKECVIPDEKLLAALHEFGLGAVLQRAGGLDAERDWPAELSLEEQQLVTLARLSLAGPCFALLDRPGSTLEPAQFRRALQRLSAGSISYVTFGEPTEAGGEYDTVLELEAGGGWSWKPEGPRRQPGEGNAVVRGPQGAGAGAGSSV
jgi:vitamin B12/bleomycin/antimicrobial peptide transport system ATP-binding/permease protein